jgi:adenylate cyclase
VVHVGVGLNTARVIAGNIGSPSRMNYTVLATAVNLAARLEGLTKRYHVPIVVGRAHAPKAVGFRLALRASLDRLGARRATA